jgi:hypothetical protein
VKNLPNQYDLFKKMDELVSDWDDGLVELRPKSNSNVEQTLADRLVIAIGLYKNATRLYQTRLRIARLQNEMGAAWLTSVPDVDEVEAKFIKRSVEKMATPELNEAIDTRTKAAITLEQGIDEVRACSLIQPTEGTNRSLRRCKEESNLLRKENATLIARIAELEKFNKIAKLFDIGKKGKDSDGLAT